MGSKSSIFKRSAIFAMLSILATCSTPSSPPDLRQADIAWTAQGNFCEPETVLVLPDDTFLVSNVCGFSSKGDGFLSLLDSQGNIIDWRIVDGLDAPLGMTIGDDIIHVIDANRVKSFSWPEFEEIAITPLNTQVANDITMSLDGVIYISDTATGRITIVSATGRLQELISNTHFAGANGVEFGPDGDLFVGGERLWRVDVTTGATEEIGPDWLTDIDGIEVEPNGIIQATPVGGPLVRLQPDGFVEVIGAEGVSSANHGYAEKFNLVLIPTGFDNTVIAIQLPEHR